MTVVLVKKEDSTIEDLSTVSCGLGRWRPTCLQPFATIHSFIGVFSILSLITWSFYTVFVSQVSNIEKAFGLSSTETGQLFTIWEVGYIVCTVIASYFAPRAHIPGVIGTSTVLYGFAGLVAILPHFVAFTYNSVNVFDDNNLTSSQNGKDGENLCIHSNVFLPTEELLDDEEETVMGNEFSKRTIAYVLLNIAMVLQGAAKAPCYPYSAQYVDDNSDKQKTGFYMGIISSVAIFGLAIGYGIGSLASRYHATLRDVGISSSDPRFIGAWWVGMTIVSIWSILIAFPMICLPRRMQNEHSEPRDISIRRTRKLSNVNQEIKEAAKTIYEIVRSPIYVLTLGAASFQALATASFFGFEPKYVETQFAIPGWKVNIIVGVSSIVSFSLGSFLGGYITKRFKFTPFLIIGFVIIIAVANIVLVLLLMFVGCSQPELLKYADDRPVNEIPCNCSDSQFLPICGSDSRSWFSPCHAGCSTGTLKEFSNCSEIFGGEAEVGLCSSDCGTLWAYALLKFLYNGVNAVASIPLFLVLLRSAGEERKSLAVGLSGAVMSIMSWLPGPSIGGAIVDSACVVWKTATATSGRYCAFYNIEMQRYRMHGAMLGMLVVSLLLLCAALFFARGLKSWEKDEKNQNADLLIEVKEKIVLKSNNANNNAD